MFNTAAPVNDNRNWPPVYLTGLQAWMTAQGVAAYDVVIYFDGDNAARRVGEYWPVNASGTPDSRTLGADASTHIDEVAVFDRALSVGELSDLFGAALTGGDLAPAISGIPSSLTLYAGLNATFSVNR
jgi:hypothetical protein